MSIMETLNTRRTYRRFAQKPVPQDVVEDMVRLCAFRPAARTVRP